MVDMKREKVNGKDNAIVNVDFKEIRRSSFLPFVRWVTRPATRDGQRKKDN